MSEQSATQPAAANIAQCLVPGNTPEAQNLNVCYASIIGQMMTFFNGAGPRLAAKFKLSPAEGRGIFLCAHQQMLGALAGMHFKMPPEVQKELTDEITKLVQRYATRTKLFLPVNFVPTEKDEQPAKYLADGLFDGDAETHTGD